MRGWLFGVLSLLLAASLCVTVDAQSVDDVYRQQLETSGADALTEELPDDTRRMLVKLGIDSFDLETWSSLDPQTALSSLRDLLSDDVESPFYAAVSALGVMLLLGFFASLGVGEGDHATVFRAVALLAVIAPMLVPLWKTMERVSAAADSASVFSLSFVPVYAGIMTAGGQTAGALSFQTVMLTASEAISFLIRTMIVPLSSVALAMGIGGAWHPQLPLGQVGSIVNRVTVWVLGISLTIFVGILSLQTVLSATADSVGGRMMRFSVAGFVPIVGGSLSEALYTVRGCLSALRGSVGGFGILATVLIVVPPLLECIVWDMALVLTGMSAQLFSLPELVTVCDAAKRFVKILIAILASSAFLMIIAVTIVSLAGGGDL